MISNLTPEQEKYLPIVADTWMSIGTSTHSADRTKAENGIELAYKLANIAPPREIVWCGSPLDCIRKLDNYVSKQSKYEYFLRGYKILRFTKKLVMKNIHAEVDFRLRSFIGQKLRTNLRKTFAKSIRPAIWDAVKYHISTAASYHRTIVRSSGWGQQDADWLVSYDYYGRVLGLHKQTKPFRGIMQVAKNAGFWIPCAKICFVSERHNQLVLNDEGKLECDYDSSIQYPDGFSVYQLDGMTVPQKLIVAPETLAIDDIFQAGNRRLTNLLIEKVGLATIIKNTAIEPYYRDKLGRLYHITYTASDGRFRVTISVIQLYDNLTGDELWYRIPQFILVNNKRVKIQTTKQVLSWLNSQT